MRASAGFRLALGLILGPCALAGTARGDALRRIDAAWLMPPGLAAVAVAAEAAPPAGGAWVRAGQMRLFGLPDLPARGLAAGWRGALAVEAGWESVGLGAFRDGRGFARAEAGARWRCGVQATWHRLQPGPGRALDQRAFDATFGSAFALGGNGFCDLRIWLPLARSGPAVLAAEPDRRFRVAVAGRRCAVALALDTGAEGRPRGSWEVLCGLGGGLGVGWRADGASGALGGELVWQRGALRLRTSHLLHPDLGFTHRFELACGCPGASPW